MPDPAPTSAAAIDRENPWPGLAPFTEDQGAFFHGRDDEIDDLTQLARLRALVVLFGQSGLGKSSLLQAGVFPRLRASGFCPIYIRLDHADGAPSPTEQIKTLVLSETTRVGAWTRPGVARPGETLWELFHHRDDRLLNARSDPIIPVLVFDQFEELFTLGAAAGARRDRAVAFMAELAELVENRPSEQLVARLEASADELEAFDFGRADYRVVITLREDFLPDLEGMKTIMPALMANRMRLARMTGTQALQAVVKPGAGLVTEEVAAAVVEFVAGARGGSIERLAELNVEPALLSVVCRELNERRRSLGQAQITADLVSGNRREILTDFYDRSVADLPAPMRTFVEDRLLTKSGFRDNLALETALEEPGVTRPLIDTLVARRLLRIEDRAGIQRVELTHDVLAEVIRASRDDRQQRHALAAVARQTRRQRWIIAGLAAAVVALCLGGLYGLHARSFALASASRTDAAFASRLLEEGNTAEGFAYFVRAARKDAHNAAIAPRLLTALMTRNFLLPEGAQLVLPAPTRALHFSLDSSRVWALGEDGVIRVITAQSRAVTAEWRFEQPVQALALPKENDRVFAVRYADAVQICDAGTGQPLTPVMRAEGGRGLGRLELSRDGRLLAQRGEAQTVIWDATTGQRRTTIDFGTRLTIPQVLSPDGQRLLTSAAGGLVRQWSTENGRPLADEMRIAGVAAGQYASVDYSRDGRLFVVGAPTGGGQLFETATGRKVGPVLTQDLVSFAFFASDGRRLFTIGTDGGFQTVRTWDAATGVPLLPPWRISGAARGLISFSNRDDGVFITLDRYGSARLWDTKAGQPLAEPTPAMGKNPRAALLPDGSMVVVAAGTSVNFFRVGAGAAKPLDLPRSPPVMSAPFVAGPSARLLWLGQDRAKVLDVSSGREAPGGFDYPRPFVGISVAGSDVRADAGAMVVITGTDNNLTQDSRAEAWMLRPGAVSRAGVLEGVPIGTAPAANWMTFSPTGDLVAIGANTSLQTMRVWSLLTGKPVSPPLTLESRLQYTNAQPVCFSSDGSRLAAGGLNGVVRVWEVATGRALFDLEPTAASPVRFIAFSPDGERIATAVGAGTFRLWEAETGKPISEPFPVEATFTDLVFSNDGRRILTGGAPGARLWDGRTGELIGEPFRETLI